MWENADQKSSEYGPFLRSALKVKIVSKNWIISNYMQVLGFSASHVTEINSTI